MDAQTAPIEALDAVSDERLGEVLMQRAEALHERAMRLADAARALGVTRALGPPRTQGGEGPRGMGSSERFGPRETDNGTPDLSRLNRARGQKVTLEMVRDKAREKGRFGKGDLANELGVSPATLTPHLQELVGRGTLKRHGGANGPSVSWEFVKPSSSEGPTSRPQSPVS